MPGAVTLRHQQLLSEASHICLTLGLIQEAKKLRERFNAHLPLDRALTPAEKDMVERWEQRVGQQSFTSMSSGNSVASQ